MSERSEPWALFTTSFLVRSDPKASGNHWQGGEARHDGARCGACERPLTLLWDLDLQDPALREAANGAFGDWTRLPLYFCWRCGCDLAYRRTAAGGLELLEDMWFDPFFVEARASGLLDTDDDPEEEPGYEPENEPDDDADDEFPYTDYPDSFPRIRLALTPIPAELHPALERLHAELEGQDVDDPISADDCKRLAAVLGRTELQHASDSWRGQLGGTPYLGQGHEHRVCGAEGCGTPMRELASIPNDPSGGLPLIEPAGTEPGNHWVQVVYQICPACRSILALNRAG